MADVTAVWRGAEYSARVGVASASGLNDGAELLRSLSVPRAPVDTSMLRQTAQVALASPMDLESAVTYDTPYAVKQHNDLDLNHPNGGEAQYLLRPLMEDGQKILEVIAKPIRAVAGA